MKKIARIIYSRFIDDDGNIIIGGTEQYLNCLCRVLLEENIFPIIYQESVKSFRTKINDYLVIGVAGANSSKKILQYIDKTNPNYKDDLLIFGTDFSICKNKFKYSIAIQHGVAWDITSQEASNLANILSILKGSLRSIKKYYRFKNCNNVVCVDYNFINWYRTQVKHIDFNYFIIPNFAKTACEINKSSEESVSIIFARRLVEYRGTKLFVKSVLPLFEKYNNIEVTIAGTGPDEKWMKNELSGIEKVYFTSFPADQSIEFHSRYDIAVVPTIGSEGTSLSLLEAMSAGCAVIASNVGGMTNIIIDGFNGRLINPAVLELREALEELIVDKHTRDYLAKNARTVVKTSFSYEKWSSNWKKVINEICED